MTAHADAAAAASPDSSQDSCPASGRWFSDPFPGSRTLVSGPQTAGLLGEGGGGQPLPAAVSPSPENEGPSGSSSGPWSDRWERAPVCTF